MRNIFVNILLIIGILPLAAQNVTNVEFWQEGKKVNISYNLDKTADVSVSISTDGGRTFSSPLKQVTGGVGKGVTPGKKTIVWDVLSEYDKLAGENICFRVSASGGKRSFTVNGVTFNMISVEGGTFTMGATPEQQNPNSDEKPTHRVTLSSYYIGETEVTQALWNAVMGKSLQQILNELGWSTHGVGDNYPMYDISWNDCQDFVSRLNSLTGEHFRLPTEAEWEFAARGGNKSKGYQYSGSNTIDEVAWYDKNSGSRVHPVATMTPNELGIYDMSGSVWEWCQDWYANYSSSTQTNPTGPSSGYNRVYRGGSWYDGSKGCCLAYRISNGPNIKYFHLGLRLALSE